MCYSSLRKFRHSNKIVATEVSNEMVVSDGRSMSNSDGILLQIEESIIVSFCETSLGLRFLILS